MSQPPLAIELEGYTIDTEGCLVFGARGKIANFTPCVCRVYRSADAEESTIAMVALGVLQNGILREDTFLICPDEINPHTLETQFVGCICQDTKGSSTEKLVYNFLRLQLSLCGQATEEYGLYFPQNGFYSLPDGQHVFIAGDTVLGDCGYDYIVHPEMRRYHLMHASNVSACESAQSLLHLLNRNPEIMVPIWTHTLLSTLRSVVVSAGLPFEYVLYISATQGFGKTTIARRLCCLYEDTQSPSAIPGFIDADSTKAALIDTLARFRDTAVLLDDICISTDARNQKDRTALAATLIRDVTKPSQKQKKSGNRTIELRCQAGLAITAEIPMKSASDITRCVAVHLSQRLTGGSEADRVTAATALYHFIQWFTTHYTE